MHDYRRLKIYELSLDIAVETYQLTQRLPASEKWGLTSQMNRCAVSIVSNIAEGAGRGDNRDFARFLRIARGSASELAAQTDLISRLNYVEKQPAVELRNATVQIIAAITSLERRIKAT